MSGDWKECSLGDLFQIKHGFAFKGAHFGTEGSHIVLTPGNFHDLGGFKKKGDKEKWYSGEVPDDYILSKGDLIVAMTEQAEGLLGSSAIIPENGRYLRNQRLGLIENVSSTDKHFLYYLFNSLPVRQQIRASCSGVKVRHTSPSRIYEVKTKIPDLPAQRRIAGILSAYDDLIENNLRRIRILEEMAQSLYREWFVHFRIPSEVLQKAGLPPEITLVDSPLGPIPDGWEVKKIKDFGAVVTGKTPSKKNEDFYGPGMSFVKTPDMHGQTFILQTNETLTELGSASQAKKTLPVGSICVSCIGTLGVVSITSEPCQTNQQINSVVLANEVAREFLFFWLRGAKQKLENLGSNGATMGNVNKSKFEGMELVSPPVELLVRFHDLTYPSLKQIESLQRRNQTLRQTRDLLLPKLLSPS
jgi:type I restriction enzyme S subunit